MLYGVLLLLLLFFSAQKLWSNVIFHILHDSLFHISHFHINTSAIQAPALTTAGYLYGHSYSPEAEKQRAEGSQVKNKSLLQMTMSPRARPRREESNKTDDFRSAFCPERLTERGEKKQMGVILETA